MASLLSSLFAGLRDVLGMAWYKWDKPYHNSLDNIGYYVVVVGYWPKVLSLTLAERQRSRCKNKDQEQSFYILASALIIRFCLQSSCRSESSNYKLLWKNNLKGTHTKNNLNYWTSPCLTLQFVCGSWKIFYICLFYPINNIYILYLLKFN